MSRMTGPQRMLYTMLQMNLRNGHGCETNLEGMRLEVTRDGTSIGYIDMVRGNHYLTDSSIARSLRQANLVFN